MLPALGSHGLCGLPWTTQESFRSQITLPQVSGAKLKAKAPASANAHLAFIWSIQTLEGKQVSICCHLRVTLREALGNSAHLHREVGLPTGCCVCAVVGRLGVSRTQRQGVPSIYKPHANRPRATGPKGRILPQPQTLQAQGTAGAILTAFHGGAAGLPHCWEL